MSSSSSSASPDHPVLLARLASFSTEINSIEDAVLILQELIERMPGELRARHLLRRIQVEQYEQESPLAKTISAMKIQALLTQAASVPEPGKRMSLAEEALALNPFHVKANELLADAALEASMPSVAAFAYETLVHRYGDDTRLLHRLARIYVNKGDLLEARAVYEELNAIDPDDLESQEAFLRLQRELARRTPQEDIAADDETATDGRTTQSLQEEITDLTDQIGSLKNDARENPENRHDNEARVRELEARIEELRRTTLDADIRYWQQQHEADPENMEALCQLGEAQMRAGQWSDAYDTFADALNDADWQTHAYIQSTVSLAHHAAAKSLKRHPNEGH